MLTPCGFIHARAEDWHPRGEGEGRGRAGSPLCAITIGPTEGTRFGDERIKMGAAKITRKGNDDGSMELLVTSRWLLAGQFFKYFLIHTTSIGSG